MSQSYSQAFTQFDVKSMPRFNEETDDNKVIGARNAILKALRKGDPVMVRDVRNGSWTTWVRGHVVTAYEHALLIGYTDKSGAYQTVPSSRLKAIVMPVDEDVATVLEFGLKSVFFLKDFRS